jgi:hypothetical protein
MVSARGPHGLLSKFSRTQELLFHSSSSSFIPKRAELTSFQTHCYSENLVALESNPRPQG